MNIIISSSEYKDSDIRLIFDQEEVTLCNSETLEDLAVEIQAYESKSKARQAGRYGIIPSGYSEIAMSKKIPKVYIWNPNPRVTSKRVFSTTEVCGYRECKNSLSFLKDNIFTALFECKECGLGTHVPLSKCNLVE